MRPRPRRAPRAMGRLLFRVASQLFGGRVNRVIESERQDGGRESASASEPRPAHPAVEAALILERALAQVESVLEQLEEGAARPAPAEERQKMVPQELTDLKRALREVVQRLEDALDHLGIEAQRFADEASRLSLIADRLEARLNGLARSLRGGRLPEEAAPTPEPESVAPEEPQFRPSDQAIGIVIAAVPGFQGLMDVQRALSALPAVEGASVNSYRNGEASLEVVLRAPMSARQIVEGLRESTGHQLLIEEARPEALRLRLRFVDQEGRGLGGVPSARAQAEAQPNG